MSTGQQLSRSALRRRFGSPLTTTLPHPDHFDPTKFDANGEPVRLVETRGKKSKLRPEEAEQVVFMVKIIRTAQQDLREYLEARGITEKNEQLRVLQALANGWRPAR